MPYATNEKTVSNGWLYVEYKWRHHYSSTNLSRNPPSICLCKMCSGSRSILRGWPHRRTSMVWKVRGLTLPITKCSHSQSLNCKSSLWNRRIMSLNKHTRIDKIHISVKKKKKKVLLHKKTLQTARKASKGRSVLSVFKTVKWTSHVAVKKYWFHYQSSFEV